MDGSLQHPAPRQGMEGSLQHPASKNDSHLVRQDLGRGFLKPSVGPMEEQDSITGLASQAGSGILVLPEARQMAQSVTTLHNTEVHCYAELYTVFHDVIYNTVILNGL